MGFNRRSSWLWISLFLALGAARSASSASFLNQNETNDGNLAQTARAFEGITFSPGSGFDLRDDGPIKCQNIIDERPFQYSCLAHLISETANTLPGFFSVLISRRENVAPEIFKHYSDRFVKTHDKSLVEKSTLTFSSKNGASRDYPLQCIQGVGSKDPSGYCVVQVTPNVTLVTVAAAAGGGDKTIAVDRSSRLMLSGLLFTLKVLRLAD
jgi:hypothetical protein